MALVCVLLKDINLVFWQLFTDVLGQPVGLISKGKQFKKNAWNRWLHLYVGNSVYGDWFSGNVRETGCWSMKLPPAHQDNNENVKEDGEMPEQQWKN